MKNSLTKFEHLKKINISNQAEFKIILDDLLSREITSKEDLLEFQQRRDDIEKAWVTEACESYLLMSRDVTDLDAKNRHNHFDEVIQPLYREYTNKLNQKFLNSEFKDQLGEKYTLLVRNIKNDQELFAEENLPLLEKIDKISSEITEISAKLVVEWDGEEKTISDVDAFLESTDRNLRKKAYESVLDVEVSVSDQLDEKFEQLVSLRHQVALQSGFSSYTQYRFKEMRRFDWSPKECFAFHQAVKKHIVPLRRELWERRKAKLGIEELTPYDLSVSEDGEEAFYIYKKGEIATLVEGAGKIVKSIDFELYKYFCQLKEHDLLDLEARKNKAPGGFMLVFPSYEQTSIFYNGVGLSQDLMVLLHELGHCFHYFLGKDVTPYSLQEWSAEVAEAGSMSMEYIGLEHAHLFLSKEQTQRLKMKKLKSTINLLIATARGDEFQHWVYQNPQHTRQLRHEKWNELGREYHVGLDCTGYEDKIGKTGWQFSHILQMPFYFIDYSISEILALSIWDQYKKNPSEGILLYKRGCGLAASKSVPNIYKAFGTRFSFGEDVLEPLAQRMRVELGLV